MAIREDETLLVIKKNVKTKLKEMSSFYKLHLIEMTRILVDDLYGQYLDDLRNADREGFTRRRGDGK